MSNGIDNAATGAMTGNGPEVTYSGSQFAQNMPSVPAQIQIITGAEPFAVPASIGNNPDSLNTLGSSTEPMDIQSSQRG